MLEYELRLIAHNIGNDSRTTPTYNQSNSCITQFLHVKKKNYHYVPPNLIRVKVSLGMGLCLTP